LELNKLLFKWQSSISKENNIRSVSLKNVMFKNGLITPIVKHKKSRSNENIQND